MAVDLFGSVGSNMGGVVSGVLNVVIKALVGILIFGAIGVFLYIRKQKKQLNIPVTIWIPRSDGKIMDQISAKGGYFKNRQPNGGEITTFRLKRKGQKMLDIMPPASRFLVGLSRHLYLVQKGVDDFEPILPDSFRFAETADGKKVALTNLKCVNQDATAWTEDTRESSKRRFTIHGFWEKYKDFIQMTIFIFIVMLAIYINWQGLKEVASALQQVADTLKPTLGSSVGIA